MRRIVVAQRLLGGGDVMLVLKHAHERFLDQLVERQALLGRQRQRLALDNRGDVHVRHRCLSPQA